jgi:hypothetical protein
MSLTKLTTDLSNVSALDDEPNDVTGLTAAQVKTTFDKAGNDIKTFINTILTAEIDALPASSVSVTAIPTFTGADVQTVLESVKTRIDTISTSNANAEVADTHTGADLRTYSSLSDRLDTNDVTDSDMVHQPAIDTVIANLGNVATMTTLAKIAANAINEIDANRYKKSEWTFGSGWLRFPTGHILNWGSVQISNQPTGVHIYFPRPYTTLYQVFTVNHSGNVSNSNTFNTSGFNYNGNGDNAWFAFGVGV